MSRRPVAVVAMSGGVDSAVAAATLLDTGFEVRGVTISLWDAPRRGDQICSDHRDAGKVADALGIPHHRIDARDEFRRDVVEPFVQSYANGATPNPCIACNARFKLGALVDWALADGADVVATGHYARSQDDESGVRLFRGVDPSRDQSYFLFETTRERLERLVFPLGGLDKEAVRRRARELRVPVAEKPSSQDLCFGSPAELVRKHGQGGRPGRVVDEAGRDLGAHGGIERFTVGQRRGLGIAAEAPLYVRAVDARRDEVRVGFTPPRARSLRTSRWNWLRRPEAGEPVLVQTRSRQVPVRALLEPDGDGLRIDFLDRGPVAAVGQGAAVYRGDELLGGGWIDAVDVLP